MLHAQGLGTTPHLVLSSHAHADSHKLIWNLHEHGAILASIL